ncbi:MAG: glycosyltransferase, partial [Candidatus Latescibacterota bacterium]
MELLGSSLSSLYYVVCSLLVLYGFYRVLLLLLFLRGRGRALPAPPDPGEWPRVTVQLPLFNERFVARRLLEAMVHLDYPRERLQIQVLDDSTDSTTRLVRRTCALLRRRGLDVQHLHRTNRSGYKAGALAAGMQSSRGDLIAIFDADF